MLHFYEAALKGSVVTLNALIQNDPLILHKVSLTFSLKPLCTYQLWQVILTSPKLY